MAAEYVPLKVSRLFGEPNRRALGLNIILENKPGALAKVANVLGASKFNIIGLDVSLMRPTDEVAHVFVAVDVTESEARVDDVVTLLKDIPVVRAIETVKPAWRHLVADERHFPLLIEEGRAILIPVSLMRSLISTVKDRLGGPASGAMRWLQGLGLGEALYLLFSEHGASKLEDFAKLLSVYLKALGWCIVKRIDVGDDYVRISVERYWECEVSSPSTMSEGHMMRGMLYCLFKGLLGPLTRVEESLCVAKGDDYCEFEVHTSLA